MDELRLRTIGNNTIAQERSIDKMKLLNITLGFYYLLMIKVLIYICGHARNENKDMS